MAASVTEPRPVPTEVMDRFASVVGHELRNPLSAVKIALQSLERRASLAPKDLTRLRIALREVDRIEKALGALVDWARPEAPQPAPVALADVLAAARDVAAPVLAERGATVADELPAGAAVLADPGQAAAALAELLANAAQAGPAGAAVRVAVQRDPAGSVAVLVEDAGPGLPETERERVFEPFVALQAGRIGLGLTLARRLARANGGDVRLEAAPGGGVRAVLSLPASA